jgi:hypothetical protein
VTERSSGTGIEQHLVHWYSSRRSFAAISEPTCWRNYTASQRPGMPPTTVATKHQQDPMPQALVGSTFNTHDPHTGVSRVRHLKGLHPVYQSPTLEVPQSTFRHKVRRISGIATLVAGQAHYVVYSCIAGTTMIALLLMGLQQGNSQATALYYQDLR